METLAFLIIIIVHFGLTISSCCYEYNTYKCYYCSGGCRGLNGQEYCDKSGYIGPFNTASFVGLIIGCIFGLVLMIVCVICVCSYCTKSTDTRRQMVHPTTDMRNDCVVHPTTGMAGASFVHFNTNIYNVHLLSPGSMHANQASSSAHGLITPASQSDMPPNYFSLNHEIPSAPPEYTANNRVTRFPILPPIHTRTGLMGNKLN